MVIKKEEPDDHPDRMPEILSVIDMVNKMAQVVAAHGMALKIIGIGIGIIVTAIIGVSFELILSKTLH